MGDLKFDLIVRNKHTKVLHHKKYYLCEIMKGLSNLFDIENYILEESRQFVGLLDKNGTEVYEGDVCRFYKFEGEPLFFYGLAYMDKERIGGSWNIIKCDNANGEEMLDSSSFWNDQYEVVGNIYDSPELMAK